LKVVSLIINCNLDVLEHRSLDNFRQYKRGDEAVLDAFNPVEARMEPKKPSLNGLRHQVEESPLKRRTVGRCVSHTSNPSFSKAGTNGFVPTFRGDVDRPLTLGNFIDDQKPITGRKIGKRIVRFEGSFSDGAPPQP
jgi:hypothetical protein